MTALARRALRSFGLVAILAGAFMSTCVLLDRLLPARDLPSVVREKMAHLVAHGNDYEAFFLGSSRVQSHVIPAIFDRDLAAQGQTMSSFNAGVAGMYPPEDAWMLDQILRLKTAHLRWVFLELQTLETTLPRTNRDTLQLLSWHDWPRFSLLCERLVTTRARRHWRDRLDEASSRWPDFFDHTLLFARYFTNLGRGSTLLRRWAFAESAPPENWTLLGRDRDGFLPAAHVPSGEELAALDKDLEKRRQRPPVMESADPVTRKALGMMIAKIQRAGATPILIVPPTARGTYFAPDPKSSEGIVVLDFCNPKKYPELYETKYRVDPSHLNAAGAEIFTHLLAAEFVKAVSNK